MAYLGIVSPEQAAITDIAQGVVYVFEAGSVARYG
jgi:hypothetical protein